MLSVTLGLACPSIFDTTTGGTPILSIRLAAVWRRSWSVFSVGLHPLAHSQNHLVNASCWKAYPCLMGRWSHSLSKLQLPLYDHHRPCFSAFIPTSLSSAILTPNDATTQYGGLDGYFGDVIDVTSELLSDNSCSLDCAKQVWSAGKDGPWLLTITLIKSQSAKKAQELVDNIRAMFTNADDLSNRDSIAYLPQNTWSAYFRAKNEFVLTNSYGQVFVLLISQPNSNFDDFAGEFDLISLISRLQMEKLSSNGYTP